ncbi:MAG: PIG-L deacetylase family protein [Acidobacteriota bacterium]
MHRLVLESGPGQFRRVLCLGAHSDDIEIGCGGAILRVLREVPDLDFRWVVFAVDQEVRQKEARRSADYFLRGAAKKDIQVRDFRTSFLPYLGTEIKEVFEEIKEEFKPDLIFTHYRYDLHQDHRLISDLTWNTFRNHLILEYEIPKYDGDLGAPNFFVDLDEQICRSKISALFRFFRTQQSKPWFDEEIFWSLLRLRGMESGSSKKYAEAFYCRKIVV